MHARASPYSRSRGRGGDSASPAIVAGEAPRWPRVGLPGRVRKSPPRQEQEGDVPGLVQLFGGFGARVGGSSYEWLSSCTTDCGNLTGPLGHSGFHKMGRINVVSKYCRSHQICRSA